MKYLVELKRLLDFEDEVEQIIETNGGHPYRLVDSLSDDEKKLVQLIQNKEETPND